MTININTTHTITCEDAPVEDVLHQIGEVLPCLTWRTAEALMHDKIERLTHQRDEMARERNEARKQLEGVRVAGKAWREEASHLSEQVVDLMDKSRPALPEGMRIADHEEYGRVVVSPDTNINGYYCIFASDDSATSKAYYWYADPSKLTFLEEEPAPVPAPLPWPEDCEAEDLYFANAYGWNVVAKRCDPMSDSYPWFVFNPEAAYSNWCSDKQITLLARLLPDRKTGDDLV